MTWTYSLSLLTATGVTAQMTRVRLLVGDTDSGRQQLQDEEIYFVLVNQTATNYAAADCSDLLAAKYAFQVNTENSELRVSAAARHKHYVDLAKRLRANGPGEVPGGVGAGSIVAEGYAGGTSVSANESLAGNTDNVLPPFYVGQDDFPGVDQTANAREYFSE
jgi:hypothetical protein